jgi:hypothetical protein
LSSIPSSIKTKKSPWGPYNADHKSDHGGPTMKTHFLSADWMANEKKIGRGGGIIVCVLLIVLIVLTSRKSSYQGELAHFGWDNGRDLLAHAEKWRSYYKNRLID